MLHNLDSEEALSGDPSPEEKRAHKKHAYFWPQGHMVFFWVFSGVCSASTDPRRRAGLFIGPITFFVNNPWQKKSHTKSFTRKEKPMVAVDFQGDPKTATRLLRRVRNTRFLDREPSRYSSEKAPRRLQRCIAFLLLLNIRFFFSVFL